jgi:tetrahydromethanopterin S-methyltransferase subunit H
MAKTNAELLVTIQEKLEDCINYPQVSYRVGDIQFNGKEYVDYLLSMKEKLESSMPAEEVRVSFEHDITEFGEDESEMMT